MSLPSSPPSASRRAFIASGAAALALGATHLLPAAEPVTRHSGPKFKFSLAAYSYRDLFGNKETKTTLADFIDDCAKFGLEGTELTSYYFPPDATPEYLRGLRTQAFRLGLEISGTAIGNDFGVPPGEGFAKQINNTKKWIDNAAILTAPVIRIFAGHVQAGERAQDAHRRMVSGMEHVCEYAGKQGIYLALENHGGPTATAEGLLQLVRDVKSPWLGVNLDTGNFHSDDVYAEMEAVASYALNVQVKVVTSGPDKKKTPTDYGRIAKILRAANYRGYVVLEYEESGDVREECKKHLDLLREAFAKA